ncbi:MAG: AAA family ATPase [Chloroflexi bacterium]|nr:AAA family ATPase [Chloroflexota bacterium]
MTSSPRETIPGSVAGAPTGAPVRDTQLTFLFTDVEGSTRLWEQYPDAMRPALERHDAILRDAIAGANGAIVKSTGDGLMAAFGEPVDAVSAAIAAQRALLSEPWPQMCAIRVRVGINTGEAESRGGDFFGPAVNRTARIMAAGHGGQTLLSGSTATLVGGRLQDQATLRDLGEHRLKDLGRPERLFQLAHPALPADFPPLSTLDLRPNNLPTQTSAFVGRDLELQAIRERLDDDRVRLVTLTGPGGTGKTRLALRAAAEQVDRFTDGVFLVDLISASDTDDVLALLATALGLGDRSDRSPRDELIQHLRAQRILLVLDTFEQVTVASPILVDLLAECPGLKLLVTSRQALRVRGENVVTVPPLSLPAAASRASTAVELSQFEAIQLFVERARAVRSDFHLTDDNAAAVAEICRRLDGLPLAIELATARMNLFSPEALRDRLGSRLKALGSGPRDLPARQQTLRATIEWSYQLLDPAEQRLLELLSVFAGASVDAVETVTVGLDETAGTALDAVEGLGSLLDKSLVRQVEASGDARAVMLETIREFAAERIHDRPEFAAAARDRHARYFAQLAATASSAVAATDRDQAADDLDLELDNLRIAWRHWVDQGDLERLGELRDGLWHIYEARGWYHATIELIQDLLAVMAKSPAGPDRWQDELTLRTTLARTITLLRGYTGEVEDAYAEALALFEGHREVPQVFPVLRSLASLHGFRGEFDRGIEYAHEILRLADAQDDASMRVDGLVLLGSYTGFTGPLEPGLAYLDQAIAAFEGAGYQPRRLRLGVDARVSGLTTSGFFLWLLGRPDQTVMRADRAVAIATDLGHPYSLAYALYHSGFAHLWRREPEIVRMRASAAIGVAETSDLPVWRALGLCLLGAATSALGRPDDGLRMIEDGLDQYQGLRTPPIFWPMIRFMQAGAHVDAERPERAFALIDEGLELGGPEDVTAPMLHIVRGDLSLLGPDADIASATASYERAYAVAERYGARMPQLRAAARLCRVATDANRVDRLAVLRAVEATFTEGLTTPDLVEAATYR